MKVLIVLLSLVLLVRAEPNVYCGRRLAMALAMVCGYDEKRDNGWVLDSQTSPFVTKPWIRETGDLDTESNSKTDNAWLPARDSNKGKHVGPWLEMEVSHKGPWLANKVDKHVGIVGPWLEMEVSHKGPWLRPHEARTASRGKRQIVMECCLKACSEDELLSYC
ncbi:uncharacterized protein LOC123704831 [Colias croceus]|uniref:uncharacterized protein LOC123704831 n=1 Tax=Colias crocea TaxID=72248 RepID=UPI001E2808B2|nr:uncharacterized protein LOC123704831 [Colias croceus]